MTSAICPCGSGKSYEECCQPFHQGLLPDTALKLMRSRYAAYALNLPDYIIKTTHPTHSQYCRDLALWRRQISEFSLHTHFKKLEILDFKEVENEATVTFVAHLLQNEQDVTFTEKSWFDKVDGVWLYRSGEVFKGTLS